MNSIMIVDDEIGVRNSIKAKIDWEQAGFVVAAEASDGEAALRLLAEGPLPDVLMTDIRMPQMDGIGLIKACKKLYPELKIVVLSGFSDYEYMQAAIQAGVKDYLLKPVGRKELVALLEKLSQEIVAERTEDLKKRSERTQRKQQLQASREGLLLRLVKEESSSLLAVKERISQLGLGELLGLGDGRSARFLAVEMRVPAGRLGDNDQHGDLLRMAFRMLCRETAETHNGAYPFYDAGHPSMMHILLLEGASSRLANDRKVAEGATGNGAEADRAAAGGAASNGVEADRAAAGGSAWAGADSLARALRHNIRHYLRLDCVIGIGDPVSDVLQFKNGYSTSMLSWSRSTVDGTHRAADGGAGEIMAALSPETERQLVIAVENGDQNTFAYLMMRILPKDQDNPMFTFTFIASRLLLLLHSVAKKYKTNDDTLENRLWECQMTIGDLQSRDLIFGQLQELGRQVMVAALKARSSGGGGSIASAVQKYVDDNFAYELTLAGLADMFHLNETYLSGLFKNRVGVTFSEYLTKLRMNKAGELLRESDLKLTDIAMLVGVSSSSYFSTSFKKYFGMSPKEYREKHADEK
ncbi:response regulator [Paenibacillus sp. LHD-117]|uniref:response regulator transcription factor n=1 Tax=Paenibacillus sp. LHD-117 TaxID=3071412 RepID=UPI0027DF7B4C|nr:response regulator [Paenibacillus sp. LHD-117]MDQ6420290.1 response regulator [Paenibacillus sp. LHD-117]